MVLYFETLKGILRDYCAFLQIVRESCEVWELESPVSNEDMKVARENLEKIQSLVRDGITEVEVSQKKG